MVLKSIPLLFSDSLFIAAVTVMHLSSGLQPVPISNYSRKNWKRIGNVIDLILVPPFLEIADHSLVYEKTQAEHKEQINVKSFRSKC